MKTTLYMATSVDGYIALTDDTTPWSEAGWAAFNAAVKKAGAVAMGRKTFEIMHRDGSLGDLDAIVFVLTSNSQIDSIKRANTGKARDIVAIQTSDVGQLAGRFNIKELLVAGGALTNQAFLREKLIDKVHVDIEPIILGDGVPFLRGLEPIKLRKTSLQEIAQDVVQIEYEVVK